MISENNEYREFVKVITLQEFDPDLPDYIDELYPHYEIKNTYIFPNQYFYIIRATDLKFIYVSPSVERITGYTPEEFPNVIFENIHSEEQNIIFKAYCAAYKYGQALTAENVGVSALQVNHRMKRKSGDYFHQLRLTTNIRLDRKGHQLFFLSVCTDISDIKFDNKVKIKIFTKDKTLFSLSNDNFQERVDRLTNREREIVKLLCQNLSSKLIANSLYISRHTVDTHRRNILKKLEIADTRQIHFFQNI